MFSMKGKVTAITGGGGGIGFAAAEAIAEAGGDVALLYRSAPNMEERSAELAKAVRRQGQVVSVRSDRARVGQAGDRGGREGLRAVGLLHRQCECGGAMGPGSCADCIGSSNLCRPEV